MPIANHSLQQPNGKNSSKRPHYDSYQPFHQANLAMQPLPYHIVGSSAAAPIEIGDDADNPNSTTNATQLQLQSPNNPMTTPVPNAAVSNLVARSTTPASAGSNAAQHALQVHHGLLASMPPPQFLAAATAHNLNALPPGMLGVMANANSNGGNAAVNSSAVTVAQAQAQQQVQRMNINNTNNAASSVLNHHARHASSMGPTPTVRMSMNGAASVSVQQQQQQPQAMPRIPAGSPHHNHATNNSAPSTHALKQQHQQLQHQYQHQHQHQRGIIMPAMNQSMPPAAAVAAFQHQAHHRVAQPNNAATANNMQSPRRQSTQQPQTTNAKRQRISGNQSHHQSNSCNPTTLNTAGAAFGGTIQQIQGKSHSQSQSHSRPPQSAASAMVKQPQKGPQEQTKMHPNLHNQQPGVSMKSKYQQHSKQQQKQPQKKQQKQSVPLMKNSSASSSAAPASKSIMKSTATTTPVAFAPSGKIAQKPAVSVTGSTVASTADNNGTNLKAPSSIATSKQTQSKKQENKAAPVAKGASANANATKTSTSSATVSTAKTPTVPAKATSNTSQKSVAKATAKSEKKSNKSDGKATSRSSKKKKSSSRSNNSHLHASDFPTMGSFADASVVRAVHEILAVIAISGGSYTHQQLLDLDLNSIKGLGSQAAFKLQSILECLVVAGVMNVVKEDDAVKESSARKYVFLRGVPLNPSLLQADNFSTNSLRDDCSMRAISPRASALPLAQLGPSLQRVAEEIEDSKDRIEILKKELRAGMPNESDKDDAKANRDPVRPPKQLLASFLLDYPSLASDMVFSAALR